MSLVLGAAFLGQPATFVHPLDFKDTDEERAAVVAYIEQTVKADYTAIGMDDPLTLRMMEEANLEAFQKLMLADDRALLDRVIDDYCSIGMCNYQTISMMYDEQAEASGRKLRWRKRPGTN